MPRFQIGGVMFNDGTDVGILGERTGRGPDRSMSALSRGIPTFGLVPGNEAADSRAADAALRSLGIPPVPGLGKGMHCLVEKVIWKADGCVIDRCLVLDGRECVCPLVLGSLKPKKRGRGPQFEPGYDAINKNAPLAFGRSDGDNVNVPAVGTVETIHGVGMGIGKK